MDSGCSPPVYLSLLGDGLASLASSDDSISASRDSNLDSANTNRSVKLEISNWS